MNVKRCTWRRAIIIWTIIASTLNACKAADVSSSKAKEEDSPLQVQETNKTVTARDDWPCWRGLRHDGISLETDFDPQALEGAENILAKSHPRLLWKKKIGKGYSGISISGDYLYTMGFVKGKSALFGLDVIYCLKESDGQVVWTLSYSSSLSEYSGPRAAPLVHEGKVYTISHDGLVYCLDASNGEIWWSVSIKDEYGTKARDPEFGFCAPPLIHENILLVNAHEYGIAFDKDCGRLLWESPNTLAGYAPPVGFFYEGKYYAAVFGAEKLFIVNVCDGSLLTSTNWPTPYQCNIADPVVWDNNIFISASYNQGSGLFKLENSQLVNIWTHKGLGHQMAPGVLLDGYYYGNDYWYYYDRGEYRAVEMATGKTMWELELGMGSIIAIGKRLLILTETGRIICAEADPHRFKPIASGSLGAARRGNWFTPPTFVRSKIFIRNYDGDVICLDLSKKGLRK